jgi:L-amino acid N-acyltransferase YncA
MVRPARADDAAAVAVIYNAGIRERSSTFETRERRPAEIAERIASEAVFLVTEGDGRVAGFAATSPYSEREAYAGIAECSVYVAPELRGRGLGSALLDALAVEAERQGLHKLVGKLFVGNEASARLVAGCGFRVVGTHERHGQLEGEWRDVILVERILAGQPTIG